MTMQEIKLDESSGGLPDLRLPIGVFFLIVAVIILFASFDHAAIAEASAVSAHADRDWGIVLLVFGALMTYFGARAGSSDDDSPSNSAAGSPATPPHSAVEERGVH